MQSSLCRSELICPIARAMPWPGEGILGSTPTCPQPRQGIRHVHPPSGLSLLQICKESLPGESDRTRRSKGRKFAAAVFILRPPPSSSTSSLPSYIKSLVSFVSFFPSSLLSFLSFFALSIHPITSFRTPWPLRHSDRAPSFFLLFFFPSSPPSHTPLPRTNTTNSTYNKMAKDKGHVNVVVIGHVDSGKSTVRLFLSSLHPPPSSHPVDHRTLDLQVRRHRRAYHRQVREGGCRVWQRFLQVRLGHGQAEGRA